MLSRLVRAAGCIVLLAALLPAFPTMAQSDRVAELIQRVNAYRADNGRSALAVNSALMTAAQRQATWLAVSHVHSHQGEGGSMPQDRAAAAGYSGLVLENVASGTLGYATPAWAVMGWAGSYGHRLSMLANGRDIGVGVAENDEETYFLLLVGGMSSTSLSALENPGESPTAVAVAEEVEAPPVPVVVVVPIVIATPDESGQIVHVVQEGQTAWAIAARYGVPLADLMAINHLGAGTMLHPGDRVIVRLGEGQAPPPAPTLPATHVVQTGETLWTVAALYDLSLDDLLALNGLARGAIIQPGDTLLLRAPDATATPEPVATAAPTELPPSPVPTDAPLPVTSTPAPTTIPTDAPTATAPPSLTPAPTATAAADLLPARVSPSDGGSGSASLDDTVIAAGIVAALIGLLVLMGGVVMMRRSRGGR
jgi:LysM repeat protein